MYKNIYKITPERLAKYGKKAVIFDSDNTVAPYEIKVPTVKLKQYFEALKENGIEAAFVSNNTSERTEIFNAELQLFCIPDAGKPSPSGILLCIEHFGIEKQNIILVGDQIFTDCLSARRMGMKAFIVPPIRDKRTLFFRFKRALEKPVLRAYDRRARRAAKHNTL